MLKILIAHITYDGHTASIDERIASTIRDKDCAVELRDIARLRRKLPIHEYDGTFIGGLIHRGKHARQLAEFVSNNLEPLNDRPAAFFSVSLSAAGNREQQRDATRCLSKFLQKTGWHPIASTIIAGALLYQKYGFFKRWMMKSIVKRGGSSDTDTSRNYVYTDWDSVDRFAIEFAGKLIGGSARRPTSIVA